MLSFSAPLLPSTHVCSRQIYGLSFILLHRGYCFYTADACAGHSEGDTCAFELCSVDSDTGGDVCDDLEYSEYSELWDIGPLCEMKL